VADLLTRLRTALTGRYTIERELGRGGMALVFLAHDLKHDRLVALKVLRPEFSVALGPERFLREIQLAAKLQHPNILPLYDSGQTDGTLYYVMPYVEGESLRDRLDREGQLPLEDAIGIAREVADALSYAHSHDVIHRDIKPENILLSGAHALVADFGIARAISAAGAEQLTQTGIAVGTPAYMSPEQASAASRIDGRADVYALGCVVYEMLAGAPPFSAPRPQGVLARHTLDPVPPLRTLRKVVPPQIERAVMKALEKAPADRFATAGQFAVALAQPIQPSRSRQPRVLVAVALGGVLVAAGWWRIHEGSARARISRLAVLPLENLTGDTAQDYFVEGMHDALVTELAKIGALSVISRRSTLGYRHTTKRVPEIARELHVDAVVGGSVVLAGDSVRISTQLIAGPTDRHLWAETYVKNRRNVLELYSDVTRAVAREVRVALTPEERARLTRARPVDPEANDLHLKGRYYCDRWTEEGFNRGIAYYRRAIDQDPTFPLAYDGLAACYTLLSFFSFAAPQDAYPKAKAAVTRALELDSTLGSAHATLGLIRLLFEFDWPGADSAFRRATQLAPSAASVHLWYAMYLTGMGRFDEAIAEGRRAIELDPLTLITSLVLGWSYFNARRYNESVAHIKKTLDLDTGFAYTHMELAWNYVKLRRFAEAARECGLALRVGSPDDQTLLGSCGWVYGHAGMRADASHLLQKLLDISKRRWVDPYGVASVYEGLDDIDRAIEWLRRAIRERSAGIAWLKTDPVLDGLRGDPRFPLLLKEVGLSN
jgi:eukaryotic-like serine/threonine-protein kinase